MNAPISESLRSCMGVLDDVDLGELVDVEEGDVVNKPGARNLQKAQTPKRLTICLREDKSKLQSWQLSQHVSGHFPVPYSYVNGKGYNTELKGYAGIKAKSYSWIFVKDLEFSISPMGGSVKNTCSESESLISFLSSRKELLLFYSGSQTSKICGGIIAGNGLIFCTRQKNSCNVFICGSAHGKQRFAVKSHFAYILKSGDQAWMNTGTPEVLLQNLLAAKKGTQPIQATNNEWITVFNTTKVNNTSSEDVHAVNRSMNFYNSPVKASELKTPKKGIC